MKDKIKQKYINTHILPTKCVEQDCIGNKAKYTPDLQYAEDRSEQEEGLWV